MLDIDEEFEDDDFDDEDFAVIDALIEYMETLPQNKVFMLNPPRIQQMRFSCAAIKHVLAETMCGAKIVCKQSDLEPTMGYIDVEGANIAITNTEQFVRAAQFANNTEVYPLATDKVRLTFTFYDILTPIDEAE